MMLSIISIVVFLLIFTWYKEPRIFLIIFQRIAFPIRKGRALHIDKQLNFAGSKILENNYSLIYEELKTALAVSKPLPKFHEVDKLKIIPSPSFQKYFSPFTSIKQPSATGTNRAR